MPHIMVVVLPTGSLRMPDRLCRLDVGKAVVIYYLQYLGLLKTGYRLRFFVVVNEHNALSARTQQVIS